MLFILFHLPTRSCNNIALGKDSFYFNPILNLSFSFSGSRLLTIFIKNSRNESDLTPVDFLCNLILSHLFLLLILSTIQRIKLFKLISKYYIESQTVFCLRNKICYYLIINKRTNDEK